MKTLCKFKIALLFCTASILFSLPVSGQSWGKFFPVDSLNQRFGQALAKRTLIYCRADTSWYEIQSEASETDSLYTLIRQGLYTKNGPISSASSGTPVDSIPFYHKTGGTYQRYSDSLVLYNKVRFVGPFADILSRSQSAPVTDNAQIYLNGNTGTVNFYAKKNGPGALAGAYSEYLMASGAMTFRFYTPAGGWRSYQIDSWGLYPTAFSTSETYNQYLGNPLYKWKRAYIDTLNITGPSFIGGKLAVGSSSTPDSTLKVTGGVNVTQGLKTGYDITVNGVTVGRGRGSDSTNTALGRFALKSNNLRTPTCCGDYYSTKNTAIGYGSLYSNTTGFLNNAIGYQALYSNTSGVQNTGIGRGALYTNTTGNRSVAIGDAALYTSNADGNVAVGQASLNKNTDGTYNTGIGNSVLQRNTIGSNNVAVGRNSSAYNTTGFSNTAVGVSALYSNTTGYRNIALGDSAGYSYTTLSNRMYLGARDSTTTGIYWNRTTGINKGYWNGKLNVKTVPVGSRTPEAMLVQDTVTGDVKRLPIPTAAPSTWTQTTGKQTSDTDTAQANYLKTNRLIVTAPDSLPVIFRDSKGRAAMEMRVTDSTYRNTFIGVDAGQKNGFDTNLYAYGAANVAVGHRALKNNVYGEYNTAIGELALYNNTGTSNTALGQAALTSNTSGSSNTALGVDAMIHNTTGGSNIGVGYQAMWDNRTGSVNTAIGMNALRLNQTGEYNIGIGYNSLYNGVTTSRRIGIGTGAGKNDTTANSFFLNNIEQNSIANDRAYSLLYGKFSGTAGSTTGQFLTVNGSLGIGTTAPSTALEVNGVVTATGGNSTAWNKAADSTKTPWYYSGGNTIQRGSGNVGINTTNPSSAKLQIAGKKAVPFAVSTDNDGSLGDSVFYIDAAGRVGIGNTSPGAGSELKVSGSAEASGSYYSTGGNFYLNRNSYGRIGNANNGTNAGFDVYVKAAFAGRWQADGKLGIGTSSPGEKLDVTGEIRCSDTLRVGNYSTYSYVIPGGSWVTSSTAQVKENITEITEPADLFTKVLTVSPKKYNFKASVFRKNYKLTDIPDSAMMDSVFRKLTNKERKDRLKALNAADSTEADKLSKRRMTGFLAEDINAMLGKPDSKEIDYAEIIAILWKTNQALIRKVNDQEARLKKIEQLLNIK